MVEVIKTEKSRHKVYLQRLGNNLRGYRIICSLPEDAPITDIVKGLLDQNARGEAVELLFHTERRKEFLNLDKLGWNIFIGLMKTSEQNDNLIKQIAENCSWSSEPMTQGLTIQVYPGEWFVIPEPIATAVLKNF